MITSLNDPEAREQIKNHGLQLDEAERQLQLFKKGVPHLKIDRPATAGNGIQRLDAGEQEKLKQKYDEALRSGLRVMKFVPASGAASRMFRDLEAMLNRYDEIEDNELKADEPEAAFAREFISNIRSFAFWDSLKAALHEDGHDADKLLESGRYRPLIEYTLTAKGLGYATMPKALIKFHKDDNRAVTSLEEHFHEGMAYARNSEDEVNLHFTVSPEFEEKFDEAVGEIRERLGGSEARFKVERSRQLPSTDTIAADEQNRPFLDENGKLLFRPGGHGALLQNLDNLDSDIVFIKNIDNVVPARLRDDTVSWKKVLGGMISVLRQQVFDAVQKLEANPDSSTINEIAELATDSLNLTLPDEFGSASDEEKKRALLYLLNRPVRVCGMVKNEGEPGGGPFWVEKKKLPNKLQIVETSQIDPEDSHQQKILQKATHFNPVDIVCSLTDKNGKPYELKNFQDPDTAFIASKSYDGRNLKALERPGLWNGGMSDWITVFVEVPVSTFNPVKTVNDLLREQHQ